ncbi:hypothetical protein ACJX0J_030742 [Zea mays]
MQHERAINEEFDALEMNKTWHLVARKHTSNILALLDKAIYGMQDSMLNVKITLYLLIYDDDIMQIREEIILNKRNKHRKINIASFIFRAKKHTFLPNTIAEHEVACVTSPALGAKHISNITWFRYPEGHIEATCFASLPPQQWLCASFYLELVSRPLANRNDSENNLHPGSRATHFCSISNKDNTAFIHHEADWTYSKYARKYITISRIFRYGCIEESGYFIYG